MIYGVIYGGVEVRQAKAALCINQNEKCYVVFCHFVFNFFYLLSHNPQSKRALWLDSRRIWIFLKKRKKAQGVSKPQVLHEILHKLCVPRVFKLSLHKYGAWGDAHTVRLCLLKVGETFLFSPKHLTLVQLAWFWLKKSMKVEKNLISEKLWLTMHTEKCMQMYTTHTLRCTESFLNLHPSACFSELQVQCPAAALPYMPAAWIISPPTTPLLRRSHQSIWRT